MTHFLIDANMPRSTAEIIRSHGHQATDVRDIRLASAPDQEIAAHARLHGMCLLTRDEDFGNILTYPPEQYAGIVVLQAPRRAGRSIVLSLLESFLRGSEVIVQLPGHLAVVNSHSIRLRPA